MAHISKKSKIMFFISGEKRTHYLASLPSLQNASTFHTRHPPLVHKPSSFVAQKSLRRSGTNIIKHKLFALSRPINKLRPKFKTHFSISTKPSRFFHNPMQKNTILTLFALSRRINKLRPEFKTHFSIWATGGLFLFIFIFHKL